MRLIDGLDANDPKRALLEEAFDKWFPGAELQLTPIIGGFSGSSIYRIDIRNAPDGKIKSGEYILKVSLASSHEEKRPESLAHEDAYSRSTQFSKQHIPDLKLCFQSEVNPIHDVMLFDVAGRSLNRYTASVGQYAELIFGKADGIVDDILNAWADKEFQSKRSACDVLKQACGYRSDYTKATELHDFINSTCGGPVFPIAGELLVNPLHLIDVLARNATHSLSPLMGLSHGDLHGGNVLFSRFSPETNPYYIIDFALSQENLVGFDLAYLELSFGLTFLGSKGESPLVSVLRALDPDFPNKVVPPSAFWIETLFRKLRMPLQNFVSDRFPARQDDFEKQILLSQVAAGINWANKPVDRSWKAAAVAYAGWAARRYLEIFLPEEWEDISRSRVQEESINESAKSLWEQLFQEAGQFDQSQGLYILVAEGQKPKAELAALGNLPWSIVVDLDPNSDEVGLHRFSSSVLGAKRSLHLFTSNIPDFDPRRSTAWMLAAGWTVKKEFFPDFHEWRWSRLPVIRDLIRGLAEKTRPTAIYCVVLPGLALDEKSPSLRIASIVRDMDEATRGRAKIFLLGGRAIGETATQLVAVPLAVGDLVRSVADTFGTRPELEGQKIPGPMGEWRTVSSERLRSLEENLVVLHSAVATTRAEVSDSSLSDFWRGRPPTWEEIASGIDIEREVNDSLRNECKKWLEAHRNHTVVVEHKPGSGGTTAAMRVAWDLHFDHPTAYIESYSAGLGDRIRELFLLSEKPVLLIADSSVLTESQREEIQRSLAHHNCRAVLLYLRRSFFPSKARAHEIIEDLSSSEVKLFKTTFLSVTTDPKRKEQLARVSNNETLKRYRLPFFYGLIAFERDFLGIEHYVQQHLVGVSRGIRSLLEHISIVTIFSNATVPEGIVYSLAGLATNSRLELRDVFGDGAANLLLTYGGGARIMHQILAEETLEHFRAGISDDWRLDLKSYSIDLISEFVNAAGPSACVDLFRQLFIDRAGSTDGVEDREDFAPIVENLDSIDVSLGHSILQHLCEVCPGESHFWSHLGRHQVYRMRRDYDKAEEYLQRAISLNKNDAVHYHTLGLVIRSRLRHDLRNLPKASSLEEVFAALNPLYSMAEGAFQEARRLSPDNVYGYVTNIQLITTSIARLMSAAAVSSVSLINSTEAELIPWMEEKLAEAEELLRAAANLYSTIEPTNEYMVQCQVELDRLYGDLDSVVERWELANAGGRGANVRSRRALANAYLARGGRKWNSLALSEKRRIADLAATNLRESGRRSDDYSLWFHAFSGTPEFDSDEAISQISLWSKRSPSWEAHYYLYVLHFLLWLGQRTNDLDEYRENVRQCQSLSFARKSRSPVWLGHRGIDSRVVSELDLGGWDKSLNFFRDDSLLGRINGVIDSIDGPTSGTILIDGRLSIFFSPGRDFAQYRSLNEKVNFCLGFSPSGPRAWRIEPGFVEGGDRVIVGAAHRGSLLVQPDDVEASHEVQIEAARRIDFERVLRFALEFIRAKARLGARVELEGLVSRLEAVQRTDILIGVSSSTAMLIEGLERYGVTSHTDSSGRVLLSAGENTEQVNVNLHTDSGDRIFGKLDYFQSAKKFGFIIGADRTRYYFSANSILPAYRGKIKAEGLIVSFFSVAGDRGPTAQGIVLHSGIVVSSTGQFSESELPERLCKFVFERLDNVETGVVDLGELIDLVENEFLFEPPVETLLQKKSVGAFIASIEGVAVFDRPPNLKVSRAHRLFIGRLPTETSFMSTVGSKAELSLTAFEEWLRQVMTSEVSEVEGIALSALGARAKIRFGVTGKVPQLLGFENYSELASVLGGYRIEGTGPQQRIHLAAAPKQATPSTKDSAIDLALEARSMFDAWLKEQLLRDPAASEGLLLAKVDEKARKRFGVTEEIPQLLGFENYSQFLSELGGYRLDGVGSQQSVYLVAAPVPTTARSRDDLVTLSLATFDAWLQELLQREPAEPEGLLFAVVGEKAKMHFNVRGKVPQLLGFDSFSKLLSALGGYHINGSGPQQRVQLVAAPKQVTPAPRGDQVALDLVAFDAWLKKLLQTDPFVSEGLLFASVGEKAKTHFGVTGKVPQLLGFENYSQLLSALGGYRIEGTRPQQRVFID